MSIPTATAITAGHVDLSFNTVPDFDLWQGRAAWQRNVHFALGLFDRVVVSARGSEVRAVEPQPPFLLKGPLFTLEFERTALVRDLSANVHVLLLREGARRPSFALGASDVGGAGRNFEGRYGVLSKTLLGQLRLTAGYGTGPELLDGPFGGLEWAPSRHLLLQGEYDARELNAAVRVRPFPEEWLGRGIPRPTVDVFWAEGEGMYWGLSVRTLADGDLGEGSREPRHAVQEPGARGAPDQLAERLAGEGFENLGIAFAEGRLRVDYENRTYNQNELDGLARVLAAASDAMPAGAREASVGVRNADLPMVRLAVPSADLRAFLGGELSGNGFADRLRVSFDDGRPRAGASPAGVRHDSRLKLDLLLEPSLQTALFTELGVADGRFSLVPRGLMRLLPGTVVEAAYRIPVDQTARFGFVEGPLPDPELDRALLHHAHSLHSTERTAFWAQWSGGRFDGDHVGLRQETLLYLEGGTWALGTDVAYLGGTFGDLGQVVATARARYLFPRWDTRLSLTGGRFLDEDWGAVGELSRFYGDTEIGLFLRHSERGSQAGVRIALPLTFSRDLKPRRIRPRMPARWEYVQQATVFADEAIIRSDIARALPSNHSLVNVYFDRDRLLPVLLRYQIARDRFWRR